MRKAGVRPGLLLMLLVALLGVGAAPVGAQDSALERQVREIASELRCPICQNLAVADSSSALAAEMRSVIRQKLVAGESRTAIVQYFVDRYGEEVLLNPPRQGFTLLVWLGAVAAVAGGALLLIVRLRRALPMASASAPPVAPAPAVPAAPDPYEALLDAELAQYKQERP